MCARDEVSLEALRCVELAPAVFASATKAVRDIVPKVHWVEDRLRHDSLSGLDVGEGGVGVIVGRAGGRWKRITGAGKLGIAAVGSSGEGRSWASAEA